MFEDEVMTSKSQDGGSVNQKAEADALDKVDKAMFSGMQWDLGFELHV